jgi:hypothetical protein
MPLVALCPRHFLADSIICMCVFNFRQAQVLLTRPWSNLFMGSSSWALHGRCSCVIKSQLAISKSNTDASSLLKSSGQHAWPRFPRSWPDATLEKPLKPGVMRCMPARRIGRDGGNGSQGWLANKPKEAVAKPWPSFCRREPEGHRHGPRSWHLAMRSAPTCFVFKEQLAPQQLD